MARAATTSDPFNAVAEPSRRHILELVAAEERSVLDIAAALGVRQPSASKHLRVLSEVGLVTARREGRQIMYRTNSNRLKVIHQWAALFEQHWRGQLQKVKARAEAAR